MCWKSFHYFHSCVYFPPTVLLCAPYPERNSSRKALPFGFQPPVLTVDNSAKLILLQISFKLIYDNFNLVVL